MGISLQISSYAQSVYRSIISKQKHRLQQTRIHTCGLIVVDIDALELQIGVAVVGAGRVDTVLIRDHLPELKRRLSVDTCLLSKS